MNNSNIYNAWSFKICFGFCRIQRLDLREGQNTAAIESLTIENKELKNKLKIMNENVARIASEQVSGLLFPSYGVRFFLTKFYLLTSLK